MSEIVPGSGIEQAVRRAVVEHPDGVWLSLSMDAYQKDGALGAGGIKLNLADPVEWFHESPFNTLFGIQSQVEEPDAYRLGTAFHVAMLDGVDGDLSAYDAVYGVYPGPLTHPRALITDAHVKDALARLGLPTGGATKADRVRRLIEVDPDAQVLEVLQERFERSGKQKVTFEEDARIRMLHRMIMRSASELVSVDGEVVPLRDAFIGGLSEVSIFWTDENGIRQRARIDKLKPRLSLDLKSFASWRSDNDFSKGLLKEIVYRGYMLQMACYEEARVQLRRLVAEGKVYGGTDEQRDILEEIAASDVWAWMFVFGITEGAPRVKAVRVNHDAPRYVEATQQREQALAQHLYYRQIFGLEPGVMWVDPVTVWTPDESDWPFG